MLSASTLLPHQLLHIWAEQNHTPVQCFTTISMHTYSTCACQAIAPHTTAKAKPAHCLHTLIQHQKENLNVCRQLLIFQQPQHKPICPLHAEQQVLWDASSCSAYTGTNILPPVPCYQHMLANMPMGNLSTTRACHRRKTQSPSGNQSINPLDTGYPLPQAQGSNPCQHKMVTVPCFSPALQPQGQVSRRQKSLSINKKTK